MAVGLLYPQGTGRGRTRPHAAANLVSSAFRCSTSTFRCSNSTFRRSTSTFRRSLRAANAAKQQHGTYVNSIWIVRTRERAQSAQRRSGAQSVCLRCIGSLNICICIPDTGSHARIHVRGSVGKRPTCTCVSHTGLYANVRRAVAHAHTKQQGKHKTSTVVCHAQS